jgi:hypothetical protein
VLSRANIALLGLPITLLEGDYRSMLAGLEMPPDGDLIAFIAPPWGKALDETRGLDLRRTEPPIMEILKHLAQTNRGYRVIFAVQTFERMDMESVAEVRAELNWSDPRLYDLGIEGRNHGILLGTIGWSP